MMNKILLLSAFVCLVLVEVRAKTDRETVERHCQVPPKDGMLDRNWAFNKSPKGGWYFSLMSKSATRSNVVSEIVNTDFEGNKENTPFCPRMLWSSEAAVVLYYDQKFVFNCENDSPFSFLKCKRNITASSDKNVKENTVDVFNTLTDNQSYMFFFRCWDDGRNDWLVLSTTKTLSETTKKLILDEAQSIGFDRNEYYEIGHENNCGTK